jgi:hypothetical protein
MNPSLSPEERADLVLKQLTLDEKLALLHGNGMAHAPQWQMPLSVYSGVQQTGAGTNGVDRPDQIAVPQLSTARENRQDYFGMGAANASTYFDIPIHIAGGTGPNQGRFGTLGRNTFRGPAYYDYDFALIKDTPFGRRASGAERMAVQFRGEFFNLFNIVNMGLPSNILTGSGFGQISKTAGTSRQIQLSLKLIY